MKNYPRFHIRQSRKGIRQVILPIPTDAYIAIGELCSELGCTMREFFLEAITNALDEKVYEKDQ